MDRRALRVRRCPRVRQSIHEYDVAAWRAGIGHPTAFTAEPYAASDRTCLTASAGSREAPRSASGDDPDGHS